DFFNRLERDGAEKTIASLFPSVTANDPAMAAMKELDRDCGAVTKVDRYKTVTFGSRAVRDEFVVLMGSCLVKWELTYLKTGVAWKLNNVHFNSSPGDW
ncbi:MAG TPA: hypothetical protein VFV30_08615, partial [Novosphingobium sp.]|nr:hypothetical protein [Novosphingobium sp.]